MNVYKMLASIFMLQLFLSCDENPFEPKYETIYDCSFESPQDTTGWKGITPEMFVNDPAPDGGEKSLYIGGGCMKPAAQIILESHIINGKYRLYCWGKKGESGGNVKLILAQNHDYFDQIELNINSQDWKLYQIEGVLKCNETSQLRLELWVGGIVYNSMFIDRLKVEKRK